MEKVHKIKWNLNIRFEVKSLSNSKIRISQNIDENIARYREIFAECADIKMRTMLLGAPLPKDYHCENDDEKCYDIIRCHIVWHYI